MQSHQMSSLAKSRGFNKLFSWFSAYRVIVHVEISLLKGGFDPGPSGHHSEGAALDLPRTKQPAEQPLTALNPWMSGMPLVQATPDKGPPSGPAAHAEATCMAQVNSYMLMVCCSA